GSCAHVRSLRSSPTRLESTDLRAGGAQPGRLDQEHGDHAELTAPPPQQFGGAPGYFQIVNPDGTRAHPPGETTALPINAQVIQIARSGQGSFFTTATVHGVHLEVYTVGDRFDHTPSRSRSR